MQWSLPRPSLLCPTTFHLKKMKKSQHRMPPGPNRLQNNEWVQRLDPTTQGKRGELAAGFGLVSMCRCLDVFFRCDKKEKRRCAVNVSPLIDTYFWTKSCTAELERIWAGNSYQKREAIKTQHRFQLAIEGQSTFVCEKVDSSKHCFEHQRRIYHFLLAGLDHCAEPGNICSSGWFRWWKHEAGWAGLLWFEETRFNTSRDNIYRNRETT